MEENQVIKEAMQLENYMKYKMNREMLVTDVDVEIIHNIIILCKNLMNTNERK